MLSDKGKLAGRPMKIVLISSYVYDSFSCANYSCHIPGGRSTNRMNTRKIISGLKNKSACYSGKKSIYIIKLIIHATKARTTRP
jgi:hypothetical protein